MPFEHHTLDNGLRLVFEPIPRIHSAALGFLAHTGSRDEPVEHAGISHFLEHMCFKGTPKRDWRQLSLDIDNIGALWNAYTWWEGTAYFHWVQDGRAQDSVDILSDMMRSTIPEQEFATEKNVILEEIAMYRDRPDSLIMDELIQDAFSGHPLGQSVLGTEKTVGALTRDAMVEYLERRYAPNNLTFIITGSFDRDRITDAVASQCGSWSAADSARNQSRPEFHPGRRIVQRENTAREHIALALPAPESCSEWATTADLLAAYLGASSNSRLFWSVVQEGLADEASADYFGFSDAGLFYVYLSVDPERAEEVLEVVRKELVALRDGIDQAALERAKTKHLTSLVCSGEHGLHRFSQIVGDLAAHTPLKALEEEIAEVDAVTPDRIARYLDQYPLAGDPALVALGPLDALNA